MHDFRNLSVVRARVNALCTTLMYNIVKDGNNIYPEFGINIILVQTNTGRLLSLPPRRRGLKLWGASQEAGFIRGCLSPGCVN